MADGFGRDSSFVARGGVGWLVLGLGFSTGGLATNYAVGGE